MRMIVEAGLVLVFATLFVLMMAVAVKAQQNDAPAPAPAAAPSAPAMEQEIIVRGRKNGEPDFQEEWEQHREEYRRLHQIYGKPDAVYNRVDRMTDVPNPDAGKSVMVSPNADVVQGRPVRR